MRIRAAICLSLLILAACQSAPVSPVVTSATATIEPVPVSLTGRPLHGNRPEVYRLMEDGHVRHIGDMAALTALAYDAHDLVAVPDSVLAGYPLALPLTRWLTGQKDTAVYFLQQGKRTKVPDEKTLEATGGNPFLVSPVTDDFLESFPISADPIVGVDTVLTPPLPQITAAAWAYQTLWTARDNGQLAAIDPSTGESREYQVPDQDVIRTLAPSGNGSVFATTVHGALLEITPPDAAGTTSPFAWLVPPTGSRLSALTVGSSLWYADSNYYDMDRGQYHIGRGLVERKPKGGTTEITLTLDPTENDPLKNVTALAEDTANNKLWVGTRFAGLLGYDEIKHTWEKYNLFNSKIPDNTINDVKIASDGSVWLATPAGVVQFAHGQWTLFPVPDDVTDQGVISLAVARNGDVWVSGEYFVGQLRGGKTWQITSAFDSLAFHDEFPVTILDGQDHPWFIGNTDVLHSEAGVWTAYSPTSKQIHPFMPVVTPDKSTIQVFPSPQTDYINWLKAWPRPPDDNGRGMHYLAYPTGDWFELRQQLARLKQLQVRWLLVNYTNRAMLLRMAPIFALAHLEVIWRPFVRPYQEYPYWAKDVAFLRSLGVPPYIQIYNEPSLGQEWEDAGKKVDQGVYLDHLLPAIRQVYDAGGYVGLQQIDLDWLRVTLRTIKAQKDDDIFQRMFFIPHAYGYNHPPAYDSDVNSVLGFRDFARVFQDEIGFVPMMVAGEGGWRPGEMQDSRFPMVTQTRHRDYLTAVLAWFQMGKLSNGEPLPDYFFAFCPWILSDPTDPAAWFDSASGDRILTIQAVEQMPPFVRKFSWEANSPSLRAG